MTPNIDADVVDAKLNALGADVTCGTCGERSWGVEATPYFLPTFTPWQMAIRLYIE
jgi:hypothetical protein